ncbi:MAG: DHH family phosphoesterase [Candidatus Heimdallarchaeota archaeon]|nr:DHH family phosphoesterase [Candidatus Heimdallarchaeota archaeon]MDH5646754.1 DHH family phosphoesterase [Candidatus Heimdallarchaeota archaeon]
MFQYYIDYLSKNNGIHIAILLHHNADPDAICSAIALSAFNNSLGKNITTSIYSDGINLVSKRILTSFNVNINQDNILDENTFGLIVTVDTANLSQLGKYVDWVEKSKLPVIMIDHHDTNHADPQLNMVDINSSSTCYIIAKLFLYQNLPIPADISTILMCGHISDSRRFLYASNAEVFDLTSKLIGFGGDFNLANELLQNRMSISERIARIKSAKRLTYKILKSDILLVCSYIGAFESSSARNFLSMGSDIVLVLAQKDNELRGSARVNSYVDINIGDVMAELAEEYEGTGGGHAAAAGLNISKKFSKKDQNVLIEKFISKVEKKLS